jgi:hypothetical protein
MARKPSIMRSLGSFMGHLWHSSTKELDKTERQEVRRDVEEEVRETKDGRKVVVRRTTIEEIELRSEEQKRDRD